jgi:hypothetical protein
MSEPYDVSTAAHLARGRRVLCNRHGETWDVCADCGAVPTDCLCGRDELARLRARIAALEAERDHFQALAHERFLMLARAQRVEAAEATEATPLRVWVGTRLVEVVLGRHDGRWTVGLDIGEPDLSRLKPAPEADQ